MEIIIDKIKYTIKPIPLDLIPYAMRLAVLLQTKAKDLIVAQTISEEINELIRRILSRTVSPYPKEEHQLRIFVEVMRLTDLELSFNELKFNPARRT